MRFHPGIFIGLILILAGLSLVVKALFGVHLPVARTLLALVLLYAGIKLLISNRINGKSGLSKEIVFGEAVINSPSAEIQHYQILFGKAIFDFSTLNPDNLKELTSLNIRVVFGGVFLILPANLPAEIRYNLVFAGGHGPSPDHPFIGTRTLLMGNTDLNAQRWNINIEVLFGGLHIEQRRNGT